VSSTIVEIDAQSNTFESLSTRAYGTPEHADLIRSANGTFKDRETIPIGVTLIIPDRQADPGAQSSKTESAFSPNVKQSVEDDGTNNVSLSIDGKEFQFWESLAFTRSLDAIDGITFQAPFDPEYAEFREMFRPLSFKDVELKIGGGLAFSGTLVGVSPVNQPDRRFVLISCYSKSGVLQDCTLPPGSFPKNEISNQKLTGIASSVLAPFGLGYSFLEDPGVKFDRVAIEPAAKVFDFLVTLAKQRGFVMSSDADGDLVFWKGKTDGPNVARLKEGNPLIQSIEASFSPQQYFSEITAISPTSTGKDGQALPAKNKRFDGFRPFVFKSVDSQGVDSQQASDAALGRMFGNVVSYTANISTWRDESGARWEPNTFIEIEYPSAMIYRPTKFLIRSATFEQTSRSDTATLQLVLPSSFSETAPEVLPWE